MKTLEEVIQEAGAVIPDEAYAIAAAVREWMTMKSKRLMEISEEHSKFACDGYGSLAHKHRGELIDALAMERMRSGRALRMAKDLVRMLYRAESDVVEPPPQAQDISAGKLVYKGNDIVAHSFSAGNGWPVRLYVTSVDRSVTYYCGPLAGEHFVLPLLLSMTDSQIRRCSQISHSHNVRPELVGDELHAATPDVKTDSSWWFQSTRNVMRLVELRRAGGFITRYCGPALSKEQQAELLRLVVVQDFRQ